MEKSSFFNSSNHDRVYAAEDWAAYFATLIGNGVFPQPSTGLQVIATDGMNVTVRVGKGWIGGYCYHLTEDLTLSLPTAHGVFPRIDRVVLRLDMLERDIHLAVTSSAASPSPTPPALQRNADVWELCLADVAVGRGMIAVTQAHITDRRLDPALCGIVAGLVTQIDTAAFSAQLDAWLATFQQDSFADFVGWFEGVRAVLESNMAGRGSRIVLAATEPPGMLTNDVWFAECTI